MDGLTDITDTIRVIVWVDAAVKVFACVACLIGIWIVCRTVEKKPHRKKKKKRRNRVDQILRGG